MMKKLLIEPHYFPNIQYFAKIIGCSDLILDDKSRFLKQSYRNRTIISAANKTLSLVLPVKKGKTHLPFSEVKIEYSNNWQKDHWNSIVSAYNKSPFFLYYKDQFEPFFNSEDESLINLTEGIIRECLVALDMKEINITRLSDYNGDIEELFDFRDKIHPKEKYSVKDDSFKLVNYWQVFIDRFGFLPNLSIMDLIFNEGPEAQTIIRDSIKL